MAFCANCGAQILSGVKFCANCGLNNSQASGAPPSPSAGTMGGTENNAREIAAPGSMSKTIYGFATVGAVVALIPFASYLLIPMEVYLLYKIITRYGTLDVPPFIAVAMGLVTGSAFLKSLAAVLNVAVGFGQIANALVAFGFIVAFGLTAEHHYAKGSRTQSRT